MGFLPRKSTFYEYQTMLCAHIVLYPTRTLLIANSPCPSAAVGIDRQVDDFIANSAHPVERSNVAARRSTTPRGSASYWSRR
jgi:hypothetical protein